MTGTSNPSDSLSQLRIDRDAAAARPARWLLPVAALLAVLVIAAIVYWIASGPAAVAVETAIARRPPSAASAASVLDASGYVVARRQATVSSKVTGKVAEVFVEEGMRVEAGQVVALLDDSTEQAQLELAKANVESARAVLAEIEAELRNARLERNRLRDLAARNLTSVSSVDAAEAAYDALAARLETAKENVDVARQRVALAEDALSNMTIRAPFAGMVVTKNAQPGEMISPVSAGGGFTRTGICTIIDTDSLEVEVDVNEAYIQRVRPGQRVAATLDAYPDWQIPAEVIAIIPTADRQKATVPVRVRFLERDERILRDMGVKVAFLDAEAPPVGETPQGVLVPAEAVKDDQGGDFVWRVSGGRVEKRRVAVADFGGAANVLVTDGLAAGEIVVRSADAPLADGQKIETD